MTDRELFEELSARLLDVNTFVEALTTEGRERILTEVDSTLKGVVLEIRRLTDDVSLLSNKLPGVRQNLNACTDAIRRGAISIKTLRTQQLPNLIEDINAQSEQVVEALENATKRLSPVLDTANNNLTKLIQKLQDGNRRLKAVAQKYSETLLKHNAKIDKDVFAVARAKLGDCHKRLEALRNVVEEAFDYAQGDLLVGVKDQVEEVSGEASDSIVASVQQIVDDAVTPVIEELRGLIDDTVEDLVDVLVGLVTDSEDENSGLNEITDSVDPLVEPLLSNVEVLSSIA